MQVIHLFIHQGKVFLGLVSAKELGPRRVGDTGEGLGEERQSL